MTNSANPSEDWASGLIILFKVDVEIDGVGEEEEETEGAFVDCVPNECCQHEDPAEVCEKCRPFLKGVRIRGLPADRSYDVIELGFADGTLLEEDDCGNYRVAKTSYTVAELARKSFVLRRCQPSGGMRGDRIFAVHSENKCFDVAMYTAAKCTFTAYAAGPGGPPILGSVPVSFTLEVEWKTIQILDKGREFRVPTGLKCDVDFGHAWWRIDVAPLALLGDEEIFPHDPNNPEYDLKNFANTTMGFGPDFADYPGIAICLTEWVDINRNGSWWPGNWDVSMRDPVLPGQVTKPDAWPKPNPSVHPWVITLDGAKRGLEEAQDLYITRPFPTYNLYNKNCVHVMRDIGQAAGASVPDPGSEPVVVPISFEFRGRTIDWSLRFGPATLPGRMAEELDKLN